MKTINLFLVAVVTLSLGVVKTGFADEITDIAGTFRSVQPVGITLTIDPSSRLQTDFHLAGPGNQPVYVQFPHRLKFDEKTQLYVATGFFTSTQPGPGGYITCINPVQFDGDFYDHGDSLDANFKFPTRVYVDAYGNCHTDTYQTLPAGFERAR